MRVDCESVIEIVRKVYDYQMNICIVHIVALFSEIQ